MHETTQSRFLCLPIIAFARVHLKENNQSEQKTLWRGLNRVNCSQTIKQDSLINYESRCCYFMAYCTLFCDAWWWLDWFQGLKLCHFASEKYTKNGFWKHLKREIGNTKTESWLPCPAYRLLWLVVFIRAQWRLKKVMRSTGGRQIFFRSGPCITFRTVDSK